MSNDELKLDQKSEIVECLYEKNYTIVKVPLRFRNEKFEALKDIVKAQEMNLDV
jgi:hypothetical protein